jgi:AtzH-like/1-carboxybiuret hydrolase subunit AtzG-like
MQINNPVVIAELTKCHEVYERALIDSDIEVLDAFFWNSPHAIRFGVMENLHGADEIRAFRQGRPKINLDREIRRLDIMAFGDSAGIINLEYVRLWNGIEQHGRQTQFWFCFEEGWKIVSAHVSLPLDQTRRGSGETTYLDVASAQIGLSIGAEYRADVNGDLGRLAGVAGFLMQFPLAQDVEAAPVFQP